MPAHTEIFNECLYQIAELQCKIAQINYGLFHAPYLMTKYQGIFFIFSGKKILEQYTFVCLLNCNNLKPFAF